MKTLLPLLALTAVLALTLAACDSGVAPDTAAPELATGDDFAFGKQEKFDVCHYGWTDDPENGQHYLVSVKESAYDGLGKSDHEHHHDALCWGDGVEIDGVYDADACEAAGGGWVDPDDDYRCYGTTAAENGGLRCWQGPGGEPVIGCQSDDDGDGVWDSQDACPDTPKGVAVGSDGCEPITCATNSIGMEFTLIEAGTFRMGQDNIGAHAQEHDVTITRDFCLGTFEVTQGQWEAVMGSNPSFFSDSGPGATCGADCPVETVSWNDVQDFITALNAKEGTTAYRLPTEAEWEYAARAGTTTEWSWGSNESDAATYAWHLYNSGFTTHPVGEKQPNPWGLYDVHGNVWEWVQDWYGAYTSESVTDPTGPATGSSRVWRGGSWSSDEDLMRSANRGWNLPSFHSYLYGFRLMRTGS